MLRPPLVQTTQYLLTRLVLGFALVLPLATARADSHTVRRGETLGGISRRYGCKVAELRQANNLNGDAIRAGQKLEIPTTCSKAEPAPTATIPPAKRKKVTHEVLAGETIEEIALRYGMPLDELRARNAKVLAKGLRPGLRLKIDTYQDERAQRKITYTIEGGDTLGSIGLRFGVSVKDIQRMNPGKNPDRLRVGDRLIIYKEGKPGRSQAVGLPQHGRLVNGEQFKNVPGTFLRRDDLTWGTNETVRALKAAIADVRRKYPKVHDITVGDISRKDGGHLNPHKSHQSGLDVDIGFYFLGQPRAGPRSFPDATRVALDLDATWAFIVALVGSNEASSNVEYMFIGTPVQEKLYKYSKSKGISEAKLDWIFQYPRGSRAMRGVIRHEPGHTNHIHIRFKCPSGDQSCLGRGETTKP